jgi:hypothetical protein
MKQVATQKLRPIERVVRNMRDEGRGITEIADRIQKSPGFVRRMLKWMKLERNGRQHRPGPRPIERRVVALRSRGETYSRIAQRLGRTAGSVRQVEGFAYIKHGRDARSFNHGTELLEQTSAEARRRRKLRSTTDFQGV